MAGAQNARNGGIRPAIAQNVADGPRPNGSHLSPPRDLGRRWRRVRYNPIRNFTPERLTQALEQFDLGYLRDAALIWDVLERRDDVLKNAGPKRRKSVSRQAWEIVATEKSRAALRQKEALEFFYNNISVTDAINENVRAGFPQLVRGMMDAQFQYFAVHEIVWRPGADGLTAELRKVPLWFFENRTGRLRYTGPDLAWDGQDLDEGGWLVTCGDGIMEAASVCCMFKRFSLQDWLNFGEKFGLPGIHGECAAAKGSAEWDDFVGALESFANDWIIATAAGSKINLVEAGKTGDAPFQPMVDRMDRRLAALCRGADLSSISRDREGTGASLQGDETDTLVEDDCALVTETLNEQIDRPVIRLVFGPAAPVLANVRINPPKKRDIRQDLLVDKFLIASGAPVSVTDALERYGRPTPDGGEELLRAPRASAIAQDRATPPGDRGEPDAANEAGPDEPGLGRFLAEARELLATAMDADLAPLRDELRGAIAGELSDAELARLRDAMPEIMARIAGGTATARALADINGAALADGLSIDRAGGAALNTGTREGAIKGWETRRAGGWMPQRKAEGFVSPNVDEGLSLEEAVRRLASEEQAAARRDVVEEIPRALGVRAEVEGALGTWSDGAENSFDEIVWARDAEELDYQVAIQAMALGQKDALSFWPDPDGPHSIYAVALRGKGAAEAHAMARAAGIEFSTIIPAGDGSVIKVFDLAGQAKDSVRRLANEAGATVHERRGRGRFLTDGAETRELAAERYRGIVGEYERRYPDRKLYGGRHRHGLDPGRAAAPPPLADRPASQNSRRGFARFRDWVNREKFLAPVRPTASNESPRRSACGEAANELSESEWQRISAYGTFPNEVGLQKVERADAEAMVSAFNSFRGRAGRMFRGLPIYPGHPDADPVRYTDHRRYGKVTGLEARDDGLYGRVAWNALGRENLSEGYYLYPSPRWYLRADGRFVRPDELISVGLTNRPNIPGDPWAKNDAGDGADNPNTEGDDTMPQWLRDMLLAAGLIKPEASNEDDIRGAVKGLIAGRAAAANEKTQADGRITAITAERDTLKTERDGLKGQLSAANERAARAETDRNAQREARVDAELSGLQAAGKLTPADAGARRTELLACANEEALKGRLAELHAARPAMKTEARTRGLGERSAAVNEARDRQIAINEAVEQRMKDTGRPYAACFAAVKRDPKFKALFDAMRKPGQGD